MLGLSYLNRFRFHNDPPRPTNRRATFPTGLCPPAPGGQSSTALCRRTNASNRCPLASSTRYISFGSTSTTTPSTSNGTFSGHVKISGSASVINTVCSKWADSEPSCVTTVQPSFKIFTSGRAGVDHRLNRQRHPRPQLGRGLRHPRNSAPAVLRASTAPPRGPQIPAPR